MADTAIPHPPDEADALALVVAWATGFVTIEQVARALDLDPTLPYAQTVATVSRWMSPVVAGYCERAEALVAACSRD